MVVPPEYHGREQSYLKHRVLQAYLDRWGKKLGSTARHKPSVRLWYVDCFAGPWKSKDSNLEDTSIEIGLRALEDAAESWRSTGRRIHTSAIFVEKDQTAFKALKTHLDRRVGSVQCIPLHGEFGDHVEGIAAKLGSDPAFIFVDPTGFKGVAMAYIRPLVKCPVRDVLINVMFNDIQRFKDDPRGFLRTQMREFFGLDEADLPKGLSEEELFALYRSNLRSRCGLKFAADLAVAHPTHQRTWFRLVVGGNHPEVLRVFRDVEKSVIAHEAASVRESAKERRFEHRTGQLALGLETAAPVDPMFQDRFRPDPDRVTDQLLEALGPRGIRFRDIWPAVLEEHHITRAEVADLALAAEKHGRIEIVRSKSPVSKARPKDSDLLRRLDPKIPS